MEAYEGDEICEFSREASEEATKGFDELSPKHKFLVEVREPDDEPTAFALEAYDALAAAAKVATLLSRVRGSGPATAVTIKAATEDGRQLFPVCDECGKQAENVGKLGSNAFLCGRCLDSTLDSLVADGYVEAEVREDGVVFYRATPAGQAWFAEQESLDGSGPQQNGR